MADRILIADDEAFSRRMVASMLREDWPDGVTAVASSAEALIELTGPTANRIKMLISDFNMPGINGLQLLKAIRLGVDGVRRDLPVMLLTGHADRALIGMALALDADAFLAKPIAKGTLRDKIARVLAAPRSIKPIEAYALINPREDMLAHWREGDNLAASAVPDEESGPSISLPLAEVPEDSILAAPIRFPDGTDVVPAGRRLGRALLDRLADLKAMGLPVEPVHIQAQ
ncbi:MAG: hypothetical protein RLZZ501_1389 [Pseudomonadota bacterium]|jgi:CheY-like chemotaxis protein